MRLRRYRIDFLVNAPTSRESWNGFVFIRAANRIEAEKAVLDSHTTDGTLTVVKVKRML